MRKTRLFDCNPRWVHWTGGATASPDGIAFDCPEGHSGCVTVIPFSPALDGSKPQILSAQWERTGGSFADLTLSPSIRRTPSYQDRATAIEAGCMADCLTDSMFCALHIFIRNGLIEFCGDSR